MIFVVLSIVVMAVGLINLRKGFLLYLVLQMVWFPDTQLFSVGGSSVNLNLICSVYFILLYIGRMKKYSVINKTKFPYKRPMMLIAISMFLTTFTSLAGFFSEFVKAFGLIAMDLVIIFIIWKIIDRKEDFVFLYKTITYIIFFACIYIFYEKITNINIILDYKLTCTSNVLGTYSDYQQWDVRGYRWYSIFEHPICACMIFALYITLVLNLFMKKKKIPIIYLSILTALLCVPAMFFTQQRSGIFFLCVAFLSVVDFSKKSFWKLLLVLIVLVISVYPLISENIQLLFSIFSSKYTDNVSGSNVSMRFEQLYAVYNIMLKSPVTGLGENFIQYYTGTYASQALGFESLWFEQMAKHGLIGVISYIFMIYYSVYKIPKDYKSKSARYIALAYWLTYSLTSTPYFRTYFLYIVLFYFLKEKKMEDMEKKIV